MKKSQCKCNCVSWIQGHSQKILGVLDFEGVSIDFGLIYCKLLWQVRIRFEGFEHRTPPKYARGWIYGKILSLAWGVGLTQPCSLLGFVKMRMGLSCELLLCMDLRQVLHSQLHSAMGPWVFNRVGTSEHFELEQHIKYNCIISKFSCRPIVSKYNCIVSKYLWISWCPALGFWVEL